MAAVYNRFEGLRHPKNLVEFQKSTGQAILLGWTKPKDAFEQLYTNLYDHAYISYRRVLLGEERASPAAIDVLVLHRRLEDDAVAHLVAIASGKSESAQPKRLIKVIPFHAAVLRFPLMYIFIVIQNLREFCFVLPITRKRTILAQPLGHRVAGVEERF